MADVALAGQVGDSLSVPFRILDVAGQIARPRSLVGAVFSARVRYGGDHEADAAPDNLRVAATDAANGLAVASLPADHQLPAGDYCYEVDCRTGTRNETVLQGSLRIAGSLLP